MLRRNKLLHISSFVSEAQFQSGSLFSRSASFSYFFISRRVVLSIDMLQFEPFPISHNEVLPPVIVYALL